MSSQFSTGQKVLPSTCSENVRKTFHKISRTQNLISKISTKVSDTLFSMFTKYRDDGLKQLSQSTLCHGVEEMVIQLSIILALSHVSGDELVDITAEFISDQETRNKNVDDLLKLVNRYRQWVKSDVQAQQRDKQMSLHHAFSLVWLVQFYSDEMENNNIFTFIQSARNLFDKDKESFTTQYALGLLCYFQARVITKVTKDTLPLVAEIQSKGLSYLQNIVEHEDVLSIYEFRRLYIRNIRYYVSCLHAMNNSLYHSRKSFIEAKIKKELPSLEIITSNKILDPVTRLFDFNILYTERDEESQERLAFLRDRKDCEENVNIVPIYELTLQQSLTMTAYLGDIFSRSTMEILKKDKDFDFKAFFTPVFPMDNEEAENRLKERMEMHNLEVRREIPGDGNCQFYALSDQLTNEIKHAPFIRRTIVNWLRVNADTVLDNGAKISEFAYGRDWNAYLQDMSKNKSWGDHLTLIAASEIFNRSIVVVSSLPESTSALEIHPNIMTNHNNGTNVAPSKSMDHSIGANSASDANSNSNSSSNQQANTNSIGSINNNIQFTYNEKGEATRKLFLSHLTEFHYGSIQEKRALDQSNCQYRIVDL